MRFSVVCRTGNAHCFEDSWAYAVLIVSLSFLWRYGSLQLSSPVVLRLFPVEGSTWPQNLGTLGTHSRRKIFHCCIILSEVNIAFEESCMGSCYQYDMSSLPKIFDHLHGNYKGLMWHFRTSYQHSVHYITLHLHPFIVVSSSVIT